LDKPNSQKTQDSKLEFVRLFFGKYLENSVLENNFELKPQFKDFGVLYTKIKGSLKYNKDSEDLFEEISKNTASFKKYYYIIYILGLNQHFLANSDVKHYLDETQKENYIDLIESMISQSGIQNQDSNKMPSYANALLSKFKNQTWSSCDQSRFEIEKFSSIEQNDLINHIYFILE